MRKGFYGYSERDSTAPLNILNKSHGRANPDLISYLYLAEDENTAIAEIRPIPHNWISVATFSPIKPLKLARFYYSPEPQDKICNREDKIFGMQLSLIYSSVADDPSDYYPTQYLSEYIKNLGYDGIVYFSSICELQKCYVIFNPSEFLCNGSDLYQVTSVKYKIEKRIPF